MTTLKKKKWLACLIMSLTLVSCGMNPNASQEQNVKPEVNATNSQVTSKVNSEANQSTGSTAKADTIESVVTETYNGFSMGDMIKFTVALSAIWFIIGLIIPQPILIRTLFRRSS